MTSRSINLAGPLLHRSGAHGADGVDAILKRALSNGSLTKQERGTLARIRLLTRTEAPPPFRRAISFGAAGAIASSSGVAISGGNAPLDNTVRTRNRPADGGSATMTGGTLDFSHLGTDPLGYGEVTGALISSSGSNSILTSQTVSGTSILTFASLNFAGGHSRLRERGWGRGREKPGPFHHTPTLLLDGTIDSNVYFQDGDDFGVASYDNVKGIILDTADANVDVFLGTINNADNVYIIEAGSSGNMTLGSSTVTLHTLAQTATSSGTVSMPLQTLKVSSIGIGIGKGGLTLGASAGEGTLMAEIPEAACHSTTFPAT